MLYTVFVNSTIFGATFPVIPEFQAYHTVGSIGSNYTTGALGISLHLFDDPSGPGRYLHVLALSIPEKTVGWQGKVGSMYLSEKASGFEIGIHDQWQTPAGKGATLSLRKYNGLQFMMVIICPNKHHLIYFTWGGIGLQVPPSLPFGF